MWLVMIAACLAVIMCAVSILGIFVGRGDYYYPDDTRSYDVHTTTDSATTVHDYDYYANDRHSYIEHSRDHSYPVADASTYRVSY